MDPVIRFFRTPKLGDISLEQLRLIESYLRWRHFRSVYQEYNVPSFSRWHGRSTVELPPYDEIRKYEDYFILAYDGSGTQLGIFEQVARLPQSPQFIRWLMSKVLCTREFPPEETPYEISREQLEQFLEACNNVRRYGITRVLSDGYGYGIWKSNFDVNEEIAKVHLPLSISSDARYDNLYAKEVIDAIKSLNEILSTTDFNKQSICFELG